MRFGYGFWGMMLGGVAGLVISVFLPSEPTGWPGGVAVLVGCIIGLAIGIPLEARR